jgi:type IV pilus assembly protein PilM
MGSMNKTYFYKDKSLFGMDIGFNSLRVMQIGFNGKHYNISGYGSTVFDPTAISNGVITEPEVIAKEALNLFKNNLIGDVTTRRVAFAIPASRTFTRSMHLPKLELKDIPGAVQLEAEQYIPVPIDQLYMDHMIINHNDKETELLAVAVPKKIVDSYMDLSKLLGLDVVALETTIGSSSRLFIQAEPSDAPTVLIDFGSVSSDITIFDKNIQVTSTVPGGGDSITEIIARAVGVKRPEAIIIKTKYGLGVSKKQKEITEALTPLLDQLVKEVRRMIRYYEDRSSKKRQIGQVVTMGGGANMPGLTEYLTSHLRIPVRMCDPWQNLDFGRLQAPNNTEKSMYVTVAGLALIQPKEIFS